MGEVPALPPGIDGDERLTGVACPDCGGTLTVRAEGRSGYLHFRCRIRHAFSVGSLLATKEDVLEATLWASVRALEELAALLGDLHRLGDPYSDSCRADDARRRITELERAGAVLRGVLDGNVPLALVPSDGDGRPDERAC
jgi:two-component system, chemotaxis family, protein-glutamate methylesterase/glutaminase